jgi:Bacteriocin-protection, YdeI or OmpD-Associated
MEYIIQKFSNGMHYILPDVKIVSRLTKNGNKRAICKLNNTAEFHCAFMPKKEGGCFIIIGSALCKKLKIKCGSKVKAVFSADKSEYQFDMPEELKEVLNTDPAAHKIFHSLTKGNQRGLMYLLTLIKSTDKKIERALIIAEKIKSGITAPRLILKK